MHTPVRHTTSAIAVVSAMVFATGIIHSVDAGALTGQVAGTVGAETSYNLQWLNLLTTSLVAPVVPTTPALPTPAVINPVTPTASTPVSVPVLPVVGTPIAVPLTVPAVTAPVPVAIPNPNAVPPVPTVPALVPTPTVGVPVPVVVPPVGGTNVSAPPVLVPGTPAPTPTPTPIPTPIVPVSPNTLNPGTVNPGTLTPGTVNPGTPNPGVVPTMPVSLPFPNLFTVPSLGTNPYTVPSTWLDILGVSPVTPVTTYPSAPLNPNRKATLPDDNPTTTGLPAGSTTGVGGATGVAGGVVGNGLGGVGAGGTTTVSNSARKPTVTIDDVLGVGGATGVAGGAIGTVGQPVVGGSAGGGSKGPLVKDTCITLPYCSGDLDTSINPFNFCVGGTKPTAQKVCNCGARNQYKYTCGAL